MKIFTKLFCRHEKSYRFATSWTFCMNEGDVTGAIHIECRCVKCNKLLKEPELVADNLSIKKMQDFVLSDDWTWTKDQWCIIDDYERE